MIFDRGRVMDTIIFLIAIIAVLYVLFWAIRNDNLGEDEPSKGYFSMRDGEPDQETPDDK